MYNEYEGDGGGLVICCRSTSCRYKIAARSSKTNLTGAATAGATYLARDANDREMGAASLSAVDLMQIKSSSHKQLPPF